MASKSKSVTYKTSSGKSGIVKTGSKAYSKYASQGATFSSDAGTLRAAKDASKTRTSARSAADPLTVAENMGIDVPDRIEAEEMPGVVSDLAKKGAVATPMAPEIPTTPAAPTTPITPPTGGTPSGVAPAPTPTQNRYQQALTALQGGGIPPPSDAGAARATLASAVPKEETDTSAVDMFISEDPAINSLMAGIATLLNPQKQTSTLMQDYKKLYKEVGLDDINEELIDAETVINGTEDDIRNEIQTAGGFGTESQIQALSLARNKGLLKRYNQLVQMKTDATNQLNTLSSLNAQDKEIAQRRVDSQISAMFNMANFRQNALNNSRAQYQWMASQMGADGLYNSLSQDPRQLAFAEKILGTGPGGLQTLAATAATERARQTYLQDQDLALKRRQVSVSEANLALEREKYEDTKTPQGTVQSSTDQITFLKGATERAKALANQSGQGWLTKSFGDLVGGSKFRQLEAETNTLRSNMLTLATDPNIKKFFGPQMSNADVQLMTAAGTTLNPNTQSPEQMREELQRLDDLFIRMNAAVETGLEQEIESFDPASYY
jgi:hypothetical protein